MTRTALNEINRIGRALDVIEHRRTALLAQAADLQAEAEDYTRRRRLLEELVEVEHSTPTAEAVATVSAGPTRAVKGRELRRTAARLLWAWMGTSPVHYREWFERVLAEGYATSGKDPAASFLTNIRDSPAVVRDSSQGFYALDPTSVDRVSQAIAEAEAELADVERSLERAYAGDAQRGSVDALRTHRHRLKQQLKRLQADLQELRYVFEDDSAARDGEAAVEPDLRAA